MFFSKLFRCESIFRETFSFSAALPSPQSFWALLLSYTILLRLYIIACLTYLHQTSRLKKFEQTALLELPLQKEELKTQAAILSDMEKNLLTYPQAIRKAQEEYIRTATPQAKERLSAITAGI
jgi:hypothetical protein